MNCAKVTCPDCTDRTPRRVGELPTVGFFAGLKLHEPMAGGALYRCTRCDLLFRYPRLDFDKYSSLYDNEVTNIWDMPLLRRDQFLVKSFIENQTTVRSVLDFGCYSGHLLSSLRSNLVKFGVEVNSAAAQATRTKTGASVVKNLGELPSDLKFDVIIAMDVIEHIESPKKLVAGLLERLHPHGKLLITTGDSRTLLWRLVGARWWYSYFPEHIAFISQRWLEHNSSNLGFDVFCCKKFNYVDHTLFAKAKSFINFLFYLLAPSIHYHLRGHKSRARGGDGGVPGAGLSKDHLFIALSKRHDV
jgi:SAM-dependent methyltransferase